ncbi:unnamed protein product, partial [Allacma fusca]
TNQLDERFIQYYLYKTPILQRGRDEVALVMMRKKCQPVSNGSVFRHVPSSSIPLEWTKFAQVFADRTCSYGRNPFDVISV